MSIDVGANLGGYAVLMHPHSARVAAFEANPDLCAKLRWQSWVRPSIKVYGVALSDRAGTQTLRIPDDHGRSTLERGNDLGGRTARSVSVETRRLDDMGFRDVGFIKIDVEGHEMAVLRGAEALLRESRPALLIEAQDEHREDAVGTLGRYLAGFGYGGLLLDRGELTDFERAGSAGANHCNYIFVPDRSRFRAKAAALLAR